MTRKLVIEYVPTTALVRNSRNSRDHPKPQIRQVATSIAAFGFVNPILIDPNNVVIAGHGRLEAAISLGMEEVPVIRLAGLSDAQKRALALADNKIAANAGWDLELLAEELKFLSDVEIDFDVSVTGFSDAEVDFYIDQSQSTDADSKADALPKETPEEPTAVRAGDLWQLGRHRLICGDSTDPETFSRLLGDDRAQMVVTDPPFNVPIDGNVCGSGRIKHREFAMASGEMTKAQFTSFLLRICSNLVEFSIDGAIHFVFVDWRHLGELQTAGGQVYSEFKNLCVWNKTNAGMGSFYRSKHELVFVFKSGTAPHINNFELGQHGRHRTNVWDYPGVNSLRADRLKELQMHPTVKPVALIADAIKDCSRRGGIVLDAFAGSGTVFIAAQKTGRRACAIEIDPRYVETAIRRWEEYTGEVAIHADTGLTLLELGRHRTGSNAPNDADHHRAEES